jgi:hypothetical protein
MWRRLSLARALSLARIACTRAIATFLPAPNKDASVDTTIYIYTYYIIMGSGTKRHEEEIVTEGQRNAGRGGRRERDQGCY